MSEAAPPILQVRRAADGTWHVAITWHSGRTETTGTFQTELEAKEWSHTHLQSWLEGRKARGDG